MTMSKTLLAVSFYNTEVPATWFFNQGIHSITVEVNQEELTQKLFSVMAANKISDATTYLHQTKTPLITFL